MISLTCYTTSWVLEGGGGGGGEGGDCLMNNMLAGISIGYDVIKTSISLKYTRDIPLGIQVIVTIIELSPISLFPQRLPS